MNNHRLCLTTFLLVILIHLISSLECDKRSHQDNVPFNRKVQDSPIIVIGISLNKNIDSNIQNLFNVTFLVECILKGRPTQRIIHIVQAGSLLGRRSCQRLDVNRQHIVFLEPFFDGTYRPVDFEEVPYNNQINIILERTCGLSRTYPFTATNDTEATLTNRCPSAISIDCPSETLKTTVSPSEPTATSSTIHADLTTTSTTASLLEKDAIDLAALSLLLSENQEQQNLSLAFLQGQNHKSLFSDDETRKNGANRSSFYLFIHLILFSIVYVTL